MLKSSGWTAIALSICVMRLMPGCVLPGPCRLTLMACPRMTIIWGSDSFIDFGAFGIREDELNSLRALSSVWRDALMEVAGDYGEARTLVEFVELSGELPLRIAEVRWQRDWMGAWHKVSARGFSIADMFVFFNRVVAVAENSLFAGLAQVGRVQLELFSILRRCVVAAISCAIELGEEARDTEAGLPGEWAALRFLREMAGSGRQVAVLSVSMVNRQAFSSLTAGELQTLPALLSDQLSKLLRPQDKAFVGHEGEWLLLLSDVASQAQPALAASQIHRAFDHPVILLGGRGVSLDASIGIAMYPEHGHSADEVIQAARLARASLQASQESFAIFDTSMRVDW